MNKKSVLWGLSERRLIRQYWFIRVLVVVMVILVAYDSVVHRTPLYYIGFFYMGLVLGRGFLFTEKVRHNPEAGQFELINSGWNIALILILLAIRYFFGKTVLEHLHVVYATDALYL